MDDRAIVERQLGRPPRAFRRVVVRCPFGRPAVTEQAPYDRSGTPFPTTYYVTCRHLVAAISRLEAARGVERWSRLAAEDGELRRSLARATEEQRCVRRELAEGSVGNDAGASLDLGIGGAREPANLKCLHAHAAFALARPGYELGERILAELDPRWPDECCSSELRGGEHLDSASVTADVESARRDWEEAYRRLGEETRDPSRKEPLLAQLEAVSDELRKRCGSRYTLSELAEEYRRADAWVRHTVAERAAAPGWPRTLSVVEGAAFHVYSRGAEDYRP